MSTGIFTDDLRQEAEVCMTPRQSFIRRLQLGLGIVVAITVIGMTAILVSEQRVDAALDSSQTALRLLDDFKEVQILFSVARASEREFLLEDLRAPNFFQTGESAVLDSHAAAVGSLDALLATLSRSPDAAELQVPAIQQAISAYDESFRELVSLYRERGSVYSGVLGSIREATFTMQDLVGESKAPADAQIRGDLFQLDRDLADYLRDLDHRPRFLVTQRLQVLEEELDALPPKRAAELRRPLEAYRDAWQRLAELDDRIGRSSGSGVRGLLHDAQASVVPLTEAAVARARERFLTARRAVESASATARAVSLGAVVFAVVIGGFLAISLGRRLRRSLASVLAAVEAYAAGDRSARVGSLSHSDEFAVLGGAFDLMAETLAETTDELEEINASLELAVKGDTAGLLERIKSLVAERQEPAGRQ